MTLSYGDLARSTLCVARELAKLHLPTASKIGICLPRSEQYVQTIWGLMQAGHAYVPLDPEMPVERLKFIIQDAGLSALVVNAETREYIQALSLDGDLIDVENLLKNVSVAASVGTKFPAEPPDPKLAAYVIYTSGTTGKPKGVVVSRGNLAHMLAAMKGAWPRGAGTRHLQFAAFSFDASVLGIFNPLCHGAELVITPTEIRTDPEQIFELLRQKKITHAHLPPALLQMLPREPLPDLRLIYCGGENLDDEAVHFWSKAVELVNCYGPTETTVLATRGVLGGFKATNNSGRPLPGYQVYILEDSGALAPCGGVGEICIGGGAVAQAYSARPELTAQRFIANPFEPGRLYRTGESGASCPKAKLNF